MVSQSRRWNPQLAALRAMTARLGAIGTVSTEFFRLRTVRRVPRADGAAAARRHGDPRLRLGPLPARGRAGRPRTARRTTRRGAGSPATPTRPRCSRWPAAPATSSTAAGAARARSRRGTATWRVSGEQGTALWDGDHEPVLDAEVDAADPAGPPYSGIAGALQVFVRALRTGEPPSGEVHENVMSLAMVEAAVQSAASGRLERLDDVLERAYAQALAGGDPAGRTGRPRRMDARCGGAGRRGASGRERQDAVAEAVDVQLDSRRQPDAWCRGRGGRRCAAGTRPSSLETPGSRWDGSSRAGR